MSLSLVDVIQHSPPPQLHQPKKLFSGTKDREDENVGNPAPRAALFPL